jgi:hypothetical protein
MARKVMNHPPPKIVEIDAQQLAEVLERLQKVATAEDFAILQSLFGAYAELYELLRHKNISIERLRKTLFGASTEKLRNLLGDGNGAASSVAPSAAGEETVPPADAVPPDAAPAASSSAAAAAAAAPQEPPPKKKRKGHGRNGAADYPGAEKIPVLHDVFRPGDSCAECAEGKLYELSSPGVLIRIVGQAPLKATLYQLQKLRCNLCGKVFTAAPPADAGEEKYDATTGAMIALLKYGGGLPFLSPFPKYLPRKSTYCIE